MGPPRSGASKKSTSSKNAPGRDSRKEKKRPQQSKQETAPSRHDETGQDGNQIDLSATIPLTLQQLLLNVFKTALLTSGGPHDHDHQNEHRAQTPRAEADSEPEAQTTAPAGKDELDIKSLVQTIKSHLYNRDFDSAFADADEDLLRAYALRWSASRALGYAGIFKAVLRTLLSGSDGAEAQAQAQAQEQQTNHIVCIGGGAGAEIMALATAWRDMMDETALSDSVSRVSLEDESSGQGLNQDTTTAATSSPRPGLAVTAVDIADWSSVVDRLARTIRSPAVPATKSHPAPLQSEGADSFVVRFERANVLSLAEEGLRKLLHLQDAAAPARTVLVTLMFTLNELFSTSMAKTTEFLLRATDMLTAGTVFLVVDSPGSYSTLKLGKSAKKDAEADGASAAPQERRYPMKFLLDHTLLSVAAGKWEKVYEQDSRWWRRDAARLRYYVGEGAGLEDMRFQIHVYRRLAE
jgi:25S rRNA (uracil2843-N3)-methyltransferase